MILRRKVPAWLLLWVAAALVLVSAAQPSQYLTQCLAGVQGFTEEHDSHAAPEQITQGARRHKRHPAPQRNGDLLSANSSQVRAAARQLAPSLTWWRSRIAAPLPNPYVESPPPLRAPPATA